MLLDESGQVVRQWDSWDTAPWSFCAEIVSVVRNTDTQVVAVEDLPYGLSRQAQIKPPLRVQGMLIAHLALGGFLDRTYFIAPATWQRDAGVWKAGAEGAKEAAEALGYFAPDLLTQYADDVPPLGKEHAKERAKIRGQLKKASTDYNDAFHIADFARKKSLEGTLAKLQGVQTVAKE